MKKILLFVFALMSAAACKKDDPPLSAISQIVGKWRLTAYIHTAGDSTTAYPVPEAQSTIMIVRPDGVILDEYGRLPCCPPSRYFLNGKELIPQPTTPVEPSICPAVHCGPVYDMRITTSMEGALYVELTEGYSAWAREK